MNWNEWIFKTRLEASVQSFELLRPPAATFADCRQLQAVRRGAASQPLMKADPGRGLLHQNLWPRA
jgi:hypothetical protein